MRCVEGFLKGTQFTTGLGLPPGESQLMLVVSSNITEWGNQQKQIRPTQQKQIRLMNLPAHSVMLVAHLFLLVIYTVLLVAHLFLLVIYTVMLVAHLFSLVVYTVMLVATLGHRNNDILSG